ncbi:hypothetical protein [Streptomyces rochei]|uniref:hypothetical protein n=1 Tax=Streptomyces rochei TaxID=1928 RepID=UPI0033B149F2
MAGLLQDAAELLQKGFGGAGGPRLQDPGRGAEFEFVAADQEAEGGLVQEVGAGLDAVAERAGQVVVGPFEVVNAVDAGLAAVEAGSGQAC